MAGVQQRSMAAGQERESGMGGRARERASTGTLHRERAGRQTAREGEGDGMSGSPPPSRMLHLQTVLSFAPKK